MEEPPRRYMTRAHSKVDGSSDSSGSSFRVKGCIPEKRKALGYNNRDHSNELDTYLDNIVSEPQAKRVAWGRSVVSGLTVAPIRRSVRNFTGVAPKLIPTGSKITSMMRTVKSTKTVKFAAPGLENKENAPPTKGDSVDEHQLSISISALSVKPKRVPKSKLKQPSRTLEDPLLALSSKKAKRSSKYAQEETGDLVDDLHVPTSLGLSVKSRRPMKPLSSTKDVSKGAGLLMGKNEMKTSVLFGSPSRRITSSTMKAKEQSPQKLSGLTSPARRPPSGASRLGKQSLASVQGEASSLKFSITADFEDPFGDDDITTASLSVGRRLFTYTETNTPGPIQEQLPVTKFEDLFKPELLPVVSANHKAKFEDLNSRASNLLGPNPDLSATLPKPPIKNNVISEATAPVDDGGDVSMEGPRSWNPSRQLFPSSTPKNASTPKNHRSPSEGGSSFGFFGFEDENEDEHDENSANAAPRQAPTVVSLANKFSGIELDWQTRKSGGRGFRQALEVSSSKSRFEMDINNCIDPLLLAKENGNDIVISYSESDVRKMVPVKLGDDEMESATLYRQKMTWTPPSGNRAPKPDKESRRKRRSSGYVGVLNSAIVYIDIYTTNGSDVSASFEEKLRRLGARVVKQWNWSPISDTPATKNGITHVVFKDGSPRTLQKVKQTHGLVTCVRLSWVIACADTNSWVPENNFIYDLDDIPTGSRRVCDSGLLTQPCTPEKSTALPVPPRTEPPKSKVQQVAITPFLKEKIMLARRKSMQFAPKIGSPLARVPWNAR